jgi:hypothetical protein
MYSNYVAILCVDADSVVLVVVVVVVVADRMVVLMA